MNNGQLTMDNVVRSRGSHCVVNFPLPIVNLHMFIARFAAILLPFTACAFSQQYPAKPIKVIVGFADRRRRSHGAPRAVRAAGFRLRR